MKKKLLLSTAGLLILLITLVIIRDKATAPNGQNTDQNSTAATQTASQTPGFNKNLYSISDPASPWVIINKVNALPNSYEPQDLTQPNIGGLVRQQAATALNGLVGAAANSGLTLVMLSSYRSYQNQVATYNGYVAADGQAAADTYSARPGHSEHQTGWAVDIGNGTCNLQICFGETTTGVWIAAHAHEHGFIVRYPAGKEAVTGYQYEPWHLRYVGTELATELHKTGMTLEEFFNAVPNSQPY